MQKPYACQISGCQKRYTDPSSLRKHVKNHSDTEQAQLKRKQQENREIQNNLPPLRPPQAEPPRSKQFRKISINSIDTAREHFWKIGFSSDEQSPTVDATFWPEDHSYSTCAEVYENFVKENVHRNVKMDLKNKISEKNRQKRLGLESF